METHLESLDIGLRRLYIDLMTHYLTEIDRLVRAEVERETAALQVERDRAIQEYENEAEARREEWREAHVQARIDEYKRRAYEYREMLDQIRSVVDNTQHDSAELMEIRMILGHVA